MESLQPLITHRFWVCFGLSVVLIPVGWWMGSSSLAKEITKNRDAIEAAANGVPKGADHPNQGWIEGVKKVVDKRKTYHARHAVGLWDMQESVRRWPDSVEPAMKGAKYFGPGNNEDARSTYRTAYYDDTIARLYKIVDPIGVNSRSKEVLGLDPESGKLTDGKVLFAYETLPKVEEGFWQTRNPSWTEMWYAQQDTWLLEALLKAVKRVNDRRGAKNIYDASIRQIVTLMLRGGSKTADGAGGATDSSYPGGKGQGGMTMPGTDGGGAGGIGGLGGIGGKSPMAGGAEGAAGAGNVGGPLPITFVDKDFGKEVPRAPTSTNTEGSGSGAGSGAPGTTGGMTAAGSLMGDKGSGGPSLGGGVGSGTGAVSGSAATSTMSAYVDNDPEMPFKTRGFVLQVLMKRKDIPLLIQELTNAKESRFPVEILRIHEVDRDTDHTGLAILSGYGGGAAGAGGFEPGGGAERGMGRVGTPGLGGIGTPGLGGVGGVGPRMGQIPGANKGTAPGGRVGGGVGFGGGIGLGGGRGPVGGGIGLPVGPMGPMEGAGREGFGQQTSISFESALRDPGLGYVVIDGLMTIYQPPKEPLKEVDATDNAVPQPSGPASAKTPTGTKAPAKPNAGTSPKTSVDGKQPKIPAKVDPQSKSGTKSPVVPQPKPVGTKPKAAASNQKTNKTKPNSPGAGSAPGGNPEPKAGKPPAGKS